MKSEIKGCSPSFLSLPLNQTFAFQHRRLRSHRGLSYAASPSVCPLKRRHLAPSFFLGTSKKANYSFCNTASLTCFNNSLRLKPSQDLLCLYREDMDSFRTCTCRIYHRQLEPTPFPSPAISQDTGAISISPAALRRQSKAPATQFDPHDYMHLLLFPVPLSVMLWGGLNERPGGDPHAIPPTQALLKMCHWLLSLGIFASPGVMACWTSTPGGSQLKSKTFEIYVIIILNI